MMLAKAASLECDVQKRDIVARKPSWFPVLDLMAFLSVLKCIPLVGAWLGANARGKEGPETGKTERAPYVRIETDCQLQRGEGGGGSTGPSKQLIFGGRGNETLKSRRQPS